MEQMNMFTAINSAMDVSMEANEKSVLMGEDVGFGGVFRCSVNLQAKYGPERVFSTPLSEQGIIGFGIGLSMLDYQVICEIQFADYIFPAFDQIVNEAAKLRFRSGGQFHCGGLTIRSPCGAVGHGGLYHSQSVEAYFAHCAGLKIVVPRGPYQAKGLLMASIVDPNPVLFFEPKILYRTIEEEVPVGEHFLDLEKAEVLKEGKDLTIVSWGAQVRKILELVESMEDVDVEVIDLQTILPWDRETVIQSVMKTGRLIVSHEASLTGGFGSEIAATVQEECFLHLDAPVTRVCSPDAPFPHVHENIFMPNMTRMRESIINIMNF